MIAPQPRFLGITSLSITWLSLLYKHTAWHRLPSNLNCITHYGMKWGSR